MAIKFRVVGDVITYPYLWADEQKRKDHGKDRTVCLLLAGSSDGSEAEFLILLPITSKAPQAIDVAVEIDDVNRRHGGLDRDVSWVIVNECNWDVASNSYYYNPAIPPRGRFTVAFINKLIDQIRPMLSTKTKMVDRTERPPPRDTGFRKKDP